MSDTVTFKLNGNDVTVPKDWTVMQAAQREGVYIPHFCYHPGLSIAGVCRFCMVHVEGARKLEIACNLPVREGMVVSTTNDEVKDSHKWALEFHLVNHPLDCPVCDQAGECGLQDYYMEVGRYKSQMTRPKVLKPKAMDVGPQLVLDTERCILCSRCVRFEEEVTKTNALGIFDRGDRAIIGTYNEEKITHNYQENLVDICPVGAFTSKKFRFKQRVWFLKGRESICPGCSTGCRVRIDAKPEVKRFYRVKPVNDPAVNGEWMCDEGRRTVEHLNPEYRLAHAWFGEARGGRVHGTVAQGLAVLAQRMATTTPSDWALLVSPQYTTEEYEALFSYFVGELGVKSFYQWREPTEDRSSFDGLLLRGDRNPNTKGLMQVMQQYGGGERPVQNELAACLASGCSNVIALAPELSWTFPSLRAQLNELTALPFVSLWTTQYAASEHVGIPHLLPLKGFAEKRGSFVNYKGQVRELREAFPAAAAEARDVVEMVAGLKALVRSKDKALSV